MTPANLPFIAISDLPSLKNLEGLTAAAGCSALSWANEMDGPNQAAISSRRLTSPQPYATITITELHQRIQELAFLLGFAGQVVEEGGKGSVVMVRKNEKKLEAFRGKLHGLWFLDTVCGCGNFLVVTYRELRRLDFDVVRAIRLRTGQLVTNTGMLKNVWLTQFCSSYEK